MGPLDIEDIYELSPLQEGILFHDLYAPESGVYVVQFSCILRGDLNALAFEQVWQQLVDRHSILRTSFHWQEIDKALQVVYREVELSLKQQDWRELSPSEQEKRLESFLQADRKQGFELAQPPLMRLTLIRMDEITYKLIWSFHHLLVDGWSLSLILKEVFTHYEALCQDDSVHLERSRPYGDYIAWLQQQDLSEAAAFWRQMLEGFAAPTPLVVDTGIPADEDAGDYGEQRIKIPAATTATLKSLCRRHQLTLNTFVQGAWALLLSRYSGDEDVIFGVTVSGRPPDLSGIESIVGLFINTLPMRVRVPPRDSLLPWLRALQVQQFEMRQYEHSPLVQIQGWSEVRRSLPLFESILVFENYPLDVSLQEQDFSLEIRQVCLDERTNYPLTLVAVPGAELLLGIIYDRSRFDSATVNRMLGHLQTLLEDMVADPEQCLSDLPLLTETERRQLIVEWNRPQADHPQSQCIHKLFEARVEQTPDKVALVFEKQQLTYAALNARANQLAHYLRRQGVDAEALVGICMNQSVELVMALMAVLKAGGACVPLNPDEPEQRGRSILAGVQPLALVLTQDHLLSRFDGDFGKVVALDRDWAQFDVQETRNPVSPTVPESLAYVKWSLGRGTMVEHRGICSRLQWLQDEFALSDSGTLLQEAPLASDAATWEVFWPLAYGGRLVIATAGDRDDPKRLHRTIAEQNVSILHFVPSELAAFLKSCEEGSTDALGSLRWVLCSGEPLKGTVAKAFFQHLMCELCHLYDVSEVAAEAAAHVCQPGDDRNVLPAGRPTSNAAVYVLDKNLQLVPAGVTGEIHVAREGLARGYLHAPEETARRFIGNPFSSAVGECLFKTCDVGRWLDDGTLDVLGSTNRQVMVKGFRFDLGEVEAALLDHPSVDECRVLVRETTGRELVAYVVSTGQFSPEQFQSHLETRLPPVMRPSTYVPVPHLPLTPGGQADEEALTSIEVIDPDLVRRWESRLRSVPEIQEVVVTVQEKVERIPRLHLSDLLPEWKSIRVSAAEESAMAPVRVAAVKGKPGESAISQGDPLQWEVDAPTILPDVLRRAALQAADHGISYVQSDGSKIHQSYPDLLEEAERILAGLRRLGLQPQDKVIFQLELGQDFIPAFWGCLLGGFVPVPVSIAPTYDQPNSVVNKLHNAWKMLDQPIVLTGSQLASSVRSLATLLGIEDWRVETVDELRANEPDQSWHASQPDDLALLLLTSGSTGIPKAVMQVHRTLLSRCAGTVQMNDHSNQDVSLNWMPLDHVGGIVMFHLRDICTGCQQVQVSTDWILQEPLRWLDLIECYRATITWAPNFAYGLVNDRAQEIARRHWDLSSMRFILNGGEAIVAKTARRFLELLHPHGLPPTAMFPAWGMSETCSGVTYAHDFSLDTTTDEDPFVEVGRPIPGISLRIVHADNQVAEEGSIGRVQIKGATVTYGYYQNPELNQEVFTGDGWFDTGDLGFLREGSLTITGRAKDVIIIHGVNYYCHEIEAVVEQVEGVDVSFTAACAVRDAGSDTDKLAVFFSTPISDGGLMELIKGIRRKVVQDVGVSPAYIVPVQKEDIPKTTIGKIQRSLLRQRFEEGEFDAVLKRIDILGENANTLPNWFYRKMWRQEESASLSTQPPGGLSLVFLDRLGLGERLCAELGRFNQVCVRVEAGSDFAQLGPDRYCINPGDPNHYRRLVLSLSESNLQINQVLHLWTYDEYSGKITSLEALEQAQVQGVYSLLFLVQALAQVQDVQRLVRLYVISSHTQLTSQTDRISYEKSTMIGLLKTIPLELSWLQCRHIDLEAGRVEANAKRVFRELCIPKGKPEVAYRNGRRLISSLSRLDLLRQEKQGVPIKRGGVYLVTGGLGGIGTHLAQFLIENYRAKLILIGRTVMPPRDEWAVCLEQETRVSRRISNYLAIEATGGEFVYEAADVCDLPALQEMVAEAESRWDEPLSGIFHLAGEGNLEYHWQVVDEHWVTVETSQTFDTMFRPKVYGTWVLHQLVRDHPDVVFVSFSSVNGWSGGATFSAYSAANSFLDCYSLCQRYSLDTESYCFAWTMWDSLGMSQGNPEYASEIARRMGYHIIPKEQGFNSLIAGLRCDQPHVIVGLDGSNRYIRKHEATGFGPLQRLVAYFATEASDMLTSGSQEIEVWDRFQTRSTCDFLQVQEMPLMPDGRVDIEALLALGQTAARQEDVYLAPRTPIEEVLSGIWAEVLGVGQVGIHDNFFELGGHSLRATQLISRVHDAFEVNLPLRSLFESPTVAKLAEAMTRDPDERARIEKIAELLLKLAELSEDEADMMLAERANHPS